MYYKIINKECEAYKQLHKMRSDELLWEEENKEAVRQKTGLTWDKFLGDKGQQNFHRMTQFQGFIFHEPEKVDLKIWKEDKRHAGLFVPNTRTKVGREMSEFLSNGLKSSNFADALEILGLQIHGRFTFPYVELAGEAIVVYLDDNMEPNDENLIEITKKDFKEMLKTKGMAKRTIEVEVTYKYTLEVDDDNWIVQEYEDDDELVKDLASYRFGSGIPVIEDGGVKIEDWERVNLEIN